MQIKFTDSRIKEFSDGLFYAKNDGDPIEVTQATARDYLNRKHFLDGEWVNVFEPVAMTKKAAKDANLIGTYPEGFPHADKLAAVGIAHQSAVIMNREQLMQVDKIGGKAADAILAFHKEK